MIQASPPAQSASVPAHRRWAMLALGTAGQTASSTLLYGLSYLLPAVRAQYHLSLAGAGLLVSCPVFGALLTLAGWGVVADRYGERVALACGLLPAAAVLGLAATARDERTLGLLLVLAGGAAAAVISASGRLVIGWFPPDRRGVAMGVRQAAQPLGVGLAAAVLPPVARSSGPAAGLVFCALLCGAVGVAVAVLAVDPPRPTRDSGQGVDNPYRGAQLWRLHGAAALLCVPQFVVTGFALVFLIEVRGWSAGVAGAVLSAANLVGAAVRLLAGWWSDRVGSRVRPMRWLALATVLDLLLLVAGVRWHSALATVALLIASALTVSTNGLHNTAVAEHAGPFWAGRALGVHGVAQHAAIVFVPALAGALIGASGYAPAFAVAAVFPLAAAALIPPHASLADPFGRARAQPSPAP